MNNHPPMEKITEKDYQELRQRLEEAEDTLRAIRSGEVDALVVSGKSGDQVFTLRDAAHPYQVMVEEMNEGAATLSAKGIILYCNARFAEMLQIQMEAVIGEPISQFVPRSDHRELKRLLKEGNSGSGRGELTLQYHQEEVEVSVSVRNMDLDGSRRLVALFTNLEEIHRAEKKIHQIADQYQSLLTTSTDGFWMFDIGGKILDVNEAYCKLSGYTKKELVGRNIHEMETIETTEHMADHIHDLIRKGFDRFESQQKKENGQVMDVELSITYLKDSRQFIVFIHDITGRKHRIQELEEYRLHLEEMVKERAEQLMESEKRYRELVQYAPTAIYEVDFRTNKFITVNDAMCDVLGYSREELLNRAATDVLDEESQVRFKERIQNWMEGKDPDTNVEYRVLTKEGREIYSLLRTRFTRDGNGIPLGATVIATDITKRKKMEDEIRKKSKELQGSNAELKWFNESMVNRELRMIDLKKEVNELCQRSGLPLRYP